MNHCSQTIPRPNSLILAAHGSQCGRAAKALKLMASRLAKQDLFEQVLTTYHQGQPKFSQILEMISGNSAVVVPVFLSEGYYSKQVLPQQLRQAQGLASMKIWITPVVGTDFRLQKALLKRVEKIMQRFRWTPERTTVVVLGHGTPRSKSSTLTTQKAADFLSCQGACEIVHSAFIDESPSPRAVLEGSNSNYCMVLPFFFGGGEHVDELAQLLELKVSQLGDSAGIAGRDIQGLEYFIDRPIGEDPVMVEIIKNLAQSCDLWVPLEF